MPRILLPTKSKAGIAGRKLGDLSAGEEQAVEARASVPFVTDLDYFQSRVPRRTRRTFGSSSRKRKRLLFTEMDDFCFEANEGNAATTSSPESNAPSIPIKRSHVSGENSQKTETTINTIPSVNDHLSPRPTSHSITSMKESTAVIAAAVTPMPEEDQKPPRHTSRTNTTAMKNDELDDTSTIQDVSQPLFHIHTSDAKESPVEEQVRTVVRQPKTMKDILSFLQKHHGPPRGDFPSQQSL